MDNEKTAGSNLTPIAEYSETAAALADLRQRHQGVVYDVAKPKEMKAAKEARAEQEAALQAERERQAAEQKKLDEQAAQLKREREAAAKKAEAERLANLGLREAAQAVVDCYFGMDESNVRDELLDQLVGDLRVALSNDENRTAKAVTVNRTKKAARA